MKPNILERNELYLSLIPQDVPDERDGPWLNIWSFGFGLAVTYDPYRMMWITWDIDEVQILWRYLNSRDLIIGYNLEDFDFEILSFLGDTSQLPSFDLMKEFMELGYPRISLKNLAINNGYVEPKYKLSTVVRHFRNGNLQVAEKHLETNIKIVKGVLAKTLKSQKLRFWDPNERRKEVISTTPWQKLKGDSNV